MSSPGHSMNASIGSPVSAPAEDCVKVIVRCRPLNERELQEQSNSIVSIDGQLGRIELKSYSSRHQSIKADKAFSFDAVYGTESLTHTIYDEMASPLVDGVAAGYNATIFAYGQTGCGKSFTMEGISGSTEHQGIIPNSFDHLFSIIHTTPNYEFLVAVSYIELYNEEIRDLLASNPKTKCDLKESKERGVYIKDATRIVVKGVEDMNAVMTKGSKNRATSATLMNQDSSRSHAIFIVRVEAQKQASLNDEKRNLHVGCLNLVDLAGSERQAKTQATGDRLKEAMKINLSLSALGNVISALVDEKSTHIPYRDSKLTRLLQASLGGNSKTLMIAAISPASSNYDETLSTLRYANRAKNIKNKPTINEDPKDAMIRQYQNEIESLKRHLLEQSESSVSAIPKESNDERRLRDEHASLLRRHQDAEVAKAELMNKLSEMERELLHGGQSSKKEEEDERNRLEMRRTKIKLKKEKQKQARLLSEKERAREDAELMGAEVEDMRRVADAMKAKYVSAQEEIHDLQAEAHREKEDFLQTLHRNSMESAFFRQVADAFINADWIHSTYRSLSDVYTKSSWRSEHECWQLPPLANVSQIPDLPAIHSKRSDRNRQKVDSIRGHNDSNRKHEVTSKDRLRRIGSNEIELTDQDSDNDEYFQRGRESRIDEGSSMHFREKFQGPRQQNETNSSFWLSVSQRNLSSEEPHKTTTGSASNRPKLRSSNKKKNHAQNDSFWQRNLRVDSNI